MAGLGGRFSTVVKAKISKLLNRAEDPAETLEYGYQKQVEMLQDVKKGIAEVTTSKKRIQMQSQKMEAQVVKLDTQARQALAQGNEELARTALERKAGLQGELQSLDAQVAELERQQEQLTQNEQKLRQKIEAFRTKKEVMRARASAVEELEAAGTFDDLSRIGPGQDDIDRQLAELSTGSQVDSELERMKAELGPGEGAAPA